MSEKELQREIQYLTRLIESHKAAGSVSNDKVTKRNHFRPEQYKWNNGKGNAPHASSASQFMYKSTNKPLNRWHPSGTHSSKLNKSTRSNQHGNLVYRPAPKIDDRSSTIGTSDSSSSYSTTKDVVSCGAPLKESGIAVNGATCKLKIQQSPRYRKRKVSKSKSLALVSKRQKSKYVWNASTEYTSSQTKGCKLPNKQQLKWRRPSLDKKQLNKTTPTTNNTALKKNSNMKSPSSRHSPLKNKYKWKRRSSHESKTPQKVPQSPLVAAGKYSLVRSSLLWKHTHSKNQSSFQYRRLKYIIKHNPSRLHMKHATEHRVISKNRVWVASSDGENKQAELQPSHKTKFNHVWIGNGKDLRKTGEVTSLVLLGGSKYMLDSSKRRLKRTSTSSLIRLSSTSSDKRQALVKNYLASCALQRSRKHIWLAKKHKNKVLNKFKHYCIFFNRFGKCGRGDKCPYVHDPQRVAVCLKFLKGACEKTDGTCLLSHKVKKEKMPVCTFFLRGMCTRDTCPYLHVSVNKNASVCPDFITGYCPRGEQCTLQHVLDCPEFLSTGKCSKGKTCPLRHSKRHKQKNGFTSGRMPTSSVKTPIAFKKVNLKRVNALNEDNPNATTEKTVFTDELEFMPLDCDQAPDFIAL